MRSICLLLVTALALLSAPTQAADVIPQRAQPHRLTLRREAQRVWGLDAPSATFAAQIHQESRWRADARSPVGALGMAQFMPATARWIGGMDGELANRDPFSPTWALRALVVYDKWLYDRVRGDTPCERMAFALAAYNGGLGWVWRDQKLATASGADNGRWFGHVERFNAGRSAAAYRENRDYPRVILRAHEPRYIAAGWGQGSCA